MSGPTKKIAEELEEEEGRVVPPGTVYIGDEGVA